MGLLVHKGTVNIVQNLTLIKVESCMQRCGSSIEGYCNLLIHIEMKIPTSLKCFSKLLDDPAPCIEEVTMLFARDLELPGFPMMNRGILSSMQITIMKTFSLSATLCAMLGPTSILARRAS